MVTKIKIMVIVYRFKSRIRVVFIWLIFMVYGWNSRVMVGSTVDFVENGILHPTSSRRVMLNCFSLRLKTVMF